jgi:hypothetical protein
MRKTLKTNALKLLAKARETIADPKHWTKGSYAINANGQQVGTTYLDQVDKCCLIGALHVGAAKLAKETSQDVEEFDTERLAVEESLVGLLQDRWGYSSGSVEDWNDRLDRQHEHVLQLLDQSVELITAAPEDD